MNRFLVVAVCVTALAAVSDAGLNAMHFWGRFTRPWEAFIIPSYNLVKSVELTDNNTDGYITLQEVRADASRFDANGDGRVTRCEYVQYGVRELGARVDIINAQFDSIDRNNDNYLTTEDADMFAPFISQLDLNKDTRLSKYEMMRALRQGDLAAMRKAECEPYYLYRLPPKEMKMMKKRCAYRKYHPGMW